MRLDGGCVWAGVSLDGGAVDDGLGEVVTNCHWLKWKNTVRIKYFLENLQNVTIWHGFRGRIDTVRYLRERPAGYPARAFGVCGRWIVRR